MWKFFLIDSDGNETLVDDPEGWEDIAVTLERDNSLKGIFFDYLIDKLIFTGVGAIIIKDEYDVNGISGDMHLHIQFLCGDPGIYDTLYFGRLSFLQYHSSCGDECVVSIGIEDTSDIMLFRNNYQVDVNLNSNIAFDEETVLTDYDRLGFPLTIPSRGILQKSSGSNTVKQTTSLLEYPGWGNISGNGSTGTEQGGLMPIFSNSTLAEIDSTSINSVPFYDSGIVFNNGVNSYPTTPFIDLADNQSLRCAPENVRLQMRIKGRMIDRSNATRVVDLNAVIRQGPTAANTFLIDNQILASYSTGAFRTTEFDISYDEILSITPGDKIYVFDIITYQKLSSAAIQSLVIEWDPETFVLFTGTSYCAETEVNVYMINEAVSRTVEAITNNGIKFYSTYFGRTDSQPYSIGDNPCPGLFAITNGLNIRRRTLTDGSEADCFVTMKKLFDDLNGIYNIGLTIEPDAQRPGFNRLRFEDWRYFFQDEIGLVFKNATKIDTDVDESRIYNRLTVGYNKWTAGQYSGLDEFMTKRKYRININAVDKELNVATDLICSTYTIEITRRLDQTTEDWQYDNDLFGLCLNDNYEVALFNDPVYGSYGVVNVLDPDSCYNGRISPARSAMHWFNAIIQCIRTVGDNSKLIFTSGEGNYIASYGIKLCAIEGAELQENQTIDIFSFEDVTEGKPITYPEVLTFEHPLNWSTFARILREPNLKYKSILVYCNGVATQSWIKQLKFEPNQGLATITAIPKNLSIIPTPTPPESCTASIVPGSITVSDFDPITGTAVIDFTEGNGGATLWSYIVTQGDVPAEGPGFSGTATTHPFTVGGFAAAQWSIFIVPYCSADEPGINYAESTFILEEPEQIIELTATRVAGWVDTFRLTATVQGGGVFTGSFSFNFGGCSTYDDTTFCSGFPSAPTFKTATIFANTGETSAYHNFGWNTKHNGSLDSVVIFGMAGIDSTRIQKAPGETWDLSFE